MFVAVLQQEFAEMLGVWGKSNVLSRNKKRSGFDFLQISNGQDFQFTIPNFRCYVVLI